MSWDQSPTRSWSLVKYVDLRFKPPHKTIMGPDLFACLYREQRLLKIVNAATPIESIYLYNNQLSVIYREAAVVFSVSISSSQVVKFRIRLSGIPDRVSLCLALSEFIEVRESPPTQSSSQTQFSSGHSKHSEHLNWSHSSHSQPSSLSFKEAKCGSLSSTTNTSSDLNNRDSFPRSSSYGYLGSSQDLFSRSSQNFSMSSRSSPSPFPSLTNSDKCEKQDAQVQTDPLDVCRSSPEEIQAMLTLLLKDSSFQCLVEKIKGVLPNLNLSN